MKWYGILALFFMVGILGGLVFLGMNGTTIGITPQIVEPEPVEPEPVEPEPVEPEPVEPEPVEPEPVEPEPVEPEPVEPEPVEPEPVEPEPVEPEPVVNNQEICDELIAGVFSNLNPTPEELEETERKLKENNCGS